MREAGIHFSLYRHLSNAIETQSEYHGVRFGAVVPEKPVEKGRADIVIEDERGRPIVVIEAKREVSGNYDRDLDPYSPKVISQAFGYAGKLGAEYFATYNGSYLVLFRTFEKGVALLERKSRAYRVKDLKMFAGEFLEQVAAIMKGKLGWEPDPNAFVNRLRVFHQRLTAELLTFVNQPNKSFKVLFSKWIENQGWDLDTKEQNFRFSRQAAYLLMNKLLFYKILEDNGHDVPKLTLHDLVDPKKRREGFKKITERADFEAVYQHDPVFDEIPLSRKASLEVEEFLEELEKYELDRFQYDTIGHIYEDIIPSDERHDLGQFYTPPEIVELIVKMTIKKPDDVVLDPACGSGSFLVRSYNYLKMLKQQVGTSDDHDRILSQLYGIDINRFPAHLSAINLAMQDIGTETREVNLVVEDFFHIKPDQPQLFTETASLSKPSTSKRYQSVSTRGLTVDVVVANPPYIRQEKIKDKKKCRLHLSDMGYETISERSDIYVYFFTHAMEFLKHNGRMGFITSDKWLVAGYGKDLQDFLLDNFIIQAIVSFGHRVFDDPLVPTCVIILERCLGADYRDANVTKFLKVKQTMTMDRLVELINEEKEAGLIIDSSEHRLITLTQSELALAEKWNRSLHAPTVYWDLLGHNKITRLGNLTEITRGITTGANDFFHLSKKDVESWGIEPVFLRPLAKSIKQASSLKFSRNLTDMFIIDLQEYVRQALDSEQLHKQVGLDSSSLPPQARMKDLTEDEIKVLSTLWTEGHKGLYNYIVHSMWEKDWGKQNPPHKRPTCIQYRKRNKCWFNLGPLKTPGLFGAKGYWDRILYPLNPERVVIDCRLYEIHSEDSELLAGVLNSSLARLFREMHCRITGGGMGEMMVYEMKDMPILDTCSLTPTEKDRIRDAFKELVKRDEITSEDLNRAVLAPLGLEDQSNGFGALVESISESRRKGKQADLMIEGLDDVFKKVGKLKGADVVSRDRQSQISEF